jgi:hypothetical protein
MNFIEVFLSEFWPTFIGATFGLLIGFRIKGEPSDSPLFFLNPKQFKEVSGWSPVEQRRLLRQACMFAFKQWRYIGGIIPLSLPLAVGNGLGHIVPKAMKWSDTVWTHMAITVLIGSAGLYFGIKLLEAYVRPYLLQILGSTGKPS